MPEEGKDKDKKKKEESQPAEIKVDNTLRTEWNKYVSWLKEKGYAGDPQMDKGDYSEKAFNEYKKEHPDSVLTPEHIKPIQEDIHKYRDYFIEQVKAGKVKVEGEVKPDYSNLMAWAGTPQGALNDGRVGQYTSKFMFPKIYMEEKIPKNDIGFVPTPDEQKAGVKVYGEQGATTIPAVKTGDGVFYGGRRVAEVFHDKDKSTIKFRDDNNFTGEEAEIPTSDLQKYFGTTNTFQTSKGYNELKSKGKKAEPITASTEK